jgi:hypothetical protein
MITTMDRASLARILIAERERLTAVINVLLGPENSQTPPASVTGNMAAPGAAKDRKVRHFSEEQRQAAADRMRLMWKNRKAAGATPKAKKETKKSAE